MPKDTQLQRSLVIGIWQVIFTLCRKDGDFLLCSRFYIGNKWTNNRTQAGIGVFLKCEGMQYFYALVDA